MLSKPAADRDELGRSIESNSKNSRIIQIMEPLFEEFADILGCHYLVSGGETPFRPRLKSCFGHPNLANDRLHGIII